MKHIIPAIIPESLKHLGETLERILPFTNEVQVDVVDGEFVPFTSWPYTKGGEIADLKSYAETFHIEVDLMLMRPEEVIPAYVAAGVKDVVVHLESTDNWSDIIALKNELGFRLGLSINNDSPLEMLTEHIASVDYVQLMGIAKIGSQGQPFDERVLDRITTLRAEYPSLMISIDGSVKEETTPLLVRAGANRLVSGSAILTSESPEDTYKRFEMLAEEYSTPIL